MAARIGWSRAGSKRHFRYLDADGRRITDEQKLERIRVLAIPPAWKNVEISPSARAKLQAKRPWTVGQAGRIDGMTPAALGILAAYLRREARKTRATA